MKLLYCLFILAIAFSAITKDKGVLVLNDNNFEEALKKYNFLLVEFYTTWNGQSQKFESEYVEAAKILSEREEPLYLAKVNVVENPRLKNEFSLRRFPTLKFFRNGVASDYDYSLKKDGVVAFMERMAEAPSTAIYSTSDLKHMLKGETNILVGYFESTDSKDFKEWVTALSSINDVKAYHVISEEVAEEMKVEIPSIHFYHTESTITEYTGKITELDRWLTIYSLPLVIPFSQIYADRLFSEKHGIKTHLICIVSHSMLAEVAPVLEKIALAYREKLLVVNLPKENARLVDYFGAFDEKPVLLLMNIDTKLKYLMEGSMTEERVKEFVVDYFSGKLKPFYKSANAPETQDETLHVVVGSTFNEVYADDKNAMVLLYSPYDRKSSDLVSMFRELSAAYKGRADVMIAVMDATANEVEDFPIRSFPSIVFFKAGEGKRGVHYEGELTLAALQSFIESNRPTVDESETEL